jgi:hypothetical protein
VSGPKLERVPFRVKVVEESVFMVADDREKGRVIVIVAVVFRVPPEKVNVPAGSPRFLS